jgi:hypothetical protein
MGPSSSGGNIAGATVEIRPERGADDITRKVGRPHGKRRPIGSRWKTETGEHVLHLPHSYSATAGPTPWTITLRPARTRIRVAA